MRLGRTLQAWPTLAFVSSFKPWQHAEHCTLSSAPVLQYPGRFWTAHTSGEATQMVETCAAEVLWTLSDHYPRKLMTLLPSLCTV